MQFATIGRRKPRYRTIKQSLDADEVASTLHTWYSSITEDKDRDFDVLVQKIQQFDAANKKLASDNEKLTRIVEDDEKIMLFYEAQAQDLQDAALRGKKTLQKKLKKDKKKSIARG
jgi:hypothetical protein